MVGKREKLARKCGTKLDFESCENGAYIDTAPEHYANVQKFTQDSCTRRIENNRKYEAKDR